MNIKLDKNKEIEKLAKLIMQNKHYIKPQTHGTYFQKWCYAYKKAKEITNKNK